MVNEDNVFVLRFFILQDMTMKSEDTQYGTKKWNQKVQAKFQALTAKLVSL